MLQQPLGRRRRDGVQTHRILHGGPLNHPFRSAFECAGPTVDHGELKAVSQRAEMQHSLWLALSNWPAGGIYRPTGSQRAEKQPEEQAAKVKVATIQDDGIPVLD